MPGIYHHFGLSSAILKYTPNNVTEVNIAIGIDGVPLSKSSGGQFWPILGYIMTESSSRKKFFLLGYIMDLKNQIIVMSFFQIL